MIKSSVKYTKKKSWQMIKKGLQPNQTKKGNNQKHQLGPMQQNNAR